MSGGKSQTEQTMMVGKEKDVKGRKKETGGDGKKDGGEGKQGRLVGGRLR